eukprot:CAMPEP_0119324734 /NCGR_PEP_ID=MMETSP1333-20130426/64030_1 /TAXON_ID=418940 /ORGANISM="Scyphosphaera apsteinii, Strain RCC1455" /LENGTH=406 /DNA_ID=CAMNT_0007332513 /DNA_START=308 /DNA_END=1528 /DNA_ORIENTATION=-
MITRSHAQTRNSRNSAEALSEFQKGCLKSTFMSHIRHEANFMRDNLSSDVQLPPKYPSERAPAVYSLALLLRLLSRSAHVREAVADAAAIGFFTAAALALCWLADLNTDSLSHQMVLLSREMASDASANIHFLPSFLMLGLLGYVVSRWREFLVNCHTVQARIHDIGVSIGMAMKDGKQEEARRNLFRLYRYLNVVHGMTYASVVPQLPRSAEGYVRLGLLLPTEVQVLKSMENKQRDALIGWVGATIEGMVQGGQLSASVDYNLSYMINGLRGICARHHDLFVRNMPNLWLATARVLIDACILLNATVIALNTHSGYSHLTSPLSVAEQQVLLAVSIAWAIVTMTIVTACYWIPWSMINELAQPFGADSYDDYNLDALLGSTERTIFANLRVTFDRPAILQAQDE